jgi:ribosomal protein S18 acetylase RimI-like enzyme
MKYLVDTKKQYTDDILFHLRKHNQSFTGEKTSITKYLYIQEQDEIKGIVQANLSWDWVSISKAYYQDTQILKELIYHTKTYFDQYQITGIKLVTESQTRYEDFLEAFFEHDKIVHTNIRPWYYANLTKEIDFNSSETVHITEDNEKIIQFLNKQTHKFHKQDNIITEYEEISYVALENNQFVGGITLEVYPHSIYIHLLSIKEEYRGKGIGKELMKFPLDIAKQRGIKLLEVGTAEFQARGFYEKLGYSVVYTRKDNPKGFQCYTLIQTLEE